LGEALRGASNDGAGWHPSPGPASGARCQWRAVSVVPAVMCRGSCRRRKPFPWCHQIAAQSGVGRNVSV